MIGGEFPIAATDIFSADVWHPAATDTYTYSSGRAALYQILKFLKRERRVKRVLLPDYLCGSVLVPIKAVGLEFVFYPIKEDLKLEENSFIQMYKGCDAVIVINYFGLQDLSAQITYIRSIDDKAIIIEDDVQAYYEFKKPLENVDFKFTSLRKTFAVPDGGIVKTNHPLPHVAIPNTFGQYKAAAGLLKYMREGNFNDEIYLEMFEKGERLIDNELECGMSRIAAKLYGAVDEECVKIRRQNNARFLVSGLARIGIKPILPLAEDKVPLFVPILLNNRDEIRRRLFQHEIFCPVHWPLEGMIVRRGAEMAEHELSLICDQRYGEKDMNGIIKMLQ